MSPAEITALALAVFVLAVVPGPGVMATVACTLASGLRPAVAVVAGIVSGDLVFLLLAIFGLSYVAEALGSLFLAVRIAGAAYLMWLGLRLIFAAGKPVMEANEVQHHSARSHFLSGLAITLGNPKVIVFYLSVLPAVLDLGSLAALDVLITGLVVAGVLGGVMLGYALTAERARVWFGTRRVAKQVRQGAGAILAGTGILLLSKVR